MHQRLIHFAWILMFIAPLLTGCSKKTVPVENIKVLAAVRTAVSIQSDKQVAKSRDLVEMEISEGRISPELGKELDSVFELAEKKQWADAEKMIIKIQERYKPDPSTLHDHSHDHKH